MKRTITVILVCFMFCCPAQNSLFTELRKTIHEMYPNVNIENRLIAYNIWSVADPESRDRNKSFEKAQAVYEQARLKGGSEGILVIALNRDNLSSEARSILDKDGIRKIISLKEADLAALRHSSPGN